MINIAVKAKPMAAAFVMSSICPFRYLRFNTTLTNMNVISISVRNVLQILCNSKSPESIGSPMSFIPAVYSCLTIIGYKLK
jgi:hypothetical protein